MPEYKAPLKEMKFILHDVFFAESTWDKLLSSSEINRELADAILDEAAKVCEGLIAPLSQSGHEEGVRWKDGLVLTPDGYPRAYRQLVEGGWGGLAGEIEYGGQNMPKMLVLLFEEMLYSANIAMGLYLSLSSGAALTILTHGSNELKDKFLPKIYSGKWTGTMCLTEAHAGTDLGMIRTKAESVADGSYSITGTKIFISGGDHDLAENIVHLVLARVPGAPSGSKGISLFLVPKIRVIEDGELGISNGVSCGSVEHKMGINASATCVINFDNAQGFLIGDLNKGLSYMFTMMNYERLSVGIQGLSSAQVSYQWSSEYAHDRIQGRAPTGPAKIESPADPIVVHPDVRRMLLTQKSLVEAGRAFAVYLGMKLDVAKYATGVERECAEAYVDLLTPLSKAFLTDKGFEGTVLGQQILGGHGYVREWGMEQLVRDVRITQIYEGTNGIQAMDLLGRKIIKDDAKTLNILISEVNDFVKENNSEVGMKEFLDPLSMAVGKLDDITTFIMEEYGSGDLNIVGSSCVEYLHVLGLTMYCYMWALQCRAVTDGERKVDHDFKISKIQTARFYNQRLLPFIDSLVVSIGSGSRNIMDISDCAI